NLVENNLIRYSGTNGVYFYAGTNAPEPDPVDPTLTTRTRRNRVINNVIQDCVSDGLKVTDGDENVIIGNKFVGNGPVMHFVTSTLTEFISNSIPTNVVMKMQG